jgi:hypothetical protein
VHLTFVNLRLTDSTLSYERLAAAAFDAYLGNERSPPFGRRMRRQRGASRMHAMLPLTLFLAKLIGLLFLVFRC